MPLFRTFFITALFLLATTYAHACGVDAVSAKTDTSITIAWDVNCSKFLKVEICWKLANHSGNVCNAPAMAFYTTTGSYTIAGLQPQTPYKIKTHWRTNNSAWKEITVRIVTTNPSPAASVTALRYEKGSGKGYCVDFYWKNAPTPPQTGLASLALILKHRVVGPIGNYVTMNFDPYKHDLTNASFNTSTGEYTHRVCDFSVSRRYRAYISWRRDDGGLAGGYSDTIEWK